MVGSSLDLKDVYQVTTHRPHQKYYYSLGNTNQLAPLDMQDVTDIQLAPKRVYLKEHNTCAAWFIVGGALMVWLK